MADDLVLFSSLFQGTFSDEWKRDPEFMRYLSELTSFSIDRLTREPVLIKEEQDCVLNSTQNLAFNNYTTFIQTAQCSKDVFREFISVEGHLNNLIDKIPNFEKNCQDFGKDANDISVKRKLNSLALSRHTQLLEILEIPQLMETCTRNGYYEEALELSTHVKKMYKKHKNILIIKDIYEDSERCCNVMVDGLVHQLEGNLQLPACLRLVGIMRRMGTFTDTQLRLKFLQARDCWLQSVLSAIPKDDAYMHISKTIEACRVHLFDIVTQYKAIFPDDDSILAGIHGNAGKQSDGALFCSWLNDKIWQFICVLETDLRRGVRNRIDTLLSQCMYFGLSFSRVGADFRPLLLPIFVRFIIQSFQASVRNSKHIFHESMKHFSLSGSITSPSVLSSALPAPPTSSTLSPPHSLSPYQPLLLLTNAIITSFNDLRPFAPLALGPEITREIERLLQSTIHDIAEYHRIENGSFTQNEFEAFKQFCKIVIIDFLPFFERCLSTLYQEDQLQEMAMKSLMVLKCNEEEDGLRSLTSLSRRKVKVQVGINARSLAEPLRHLVPDVFEDIENEEINKSMAQLLGSATPTVSSQAPPTSESALSSVTPNDDDVVTTIDDDKSHDDTNGGSSITTDTSNNTITIEEPTDTVQVTTNIV